MTPDAGWEDQGAWDSPVKASVPSTPTTSAGLLSKEEKAAEMARRKEERRLVRTSLVHMQPGLNIIW
jgi:hypothetical protein